MNAKKYGEIHRINNPKDLSSQAYSLYDQGVCHYHLGLQEKKAGCERQAMQQWQKAEEKLAKALENNMMMRGTLAIDTIDNQEMLGDVYSAMGRYGEASNAYMAVISMVENLFGQENKRIFSVKEKMNYRSTR